MHMSTNHQDEKAAKADREQLAAVRVAVDEVDEQIVSLIGRRERLIRIAGTLKADSAEVKPPGVWSGSSNTFAPQRQKTSTSNSLRRPTGP